MANPGMIALITDFSTVDGYVGAMKGRIKSLAPNVDIVDITHQISPYNVGEAAFCLQNAYPHFPENTVFVTVVDPGVGTDRRGIVVKSSQHYFVGPDNGVFSYVFFREGCRYYEIMLDTMAGEISPTFHGRDVFAPLAASLVMGEDIRPNLRQISDPVKSFDLPERLDDHQFALRIIHIDHFGNLILNLTHSRFKRIPNVSKVALKIGETTIWDIQKSFGAVANRELVLTWDSSGFLQLAQNRGHAANTLSANVGDEVILTL